MPTLLRCPRHSGAAPSEQGAQAIAVVGDLSADDDPAGYRSVFKALGKSGLPSARARASYYA